MYTFGVLGLSSEAPATKIPRGDPRREKKRHEKTPRERKKKENCGWRGKNTAKCWGVRRRGVRRWGVRRRGASKGGGFEGGLEGGLRNSRLKGGGGGGGLRKGRVERSPPPSTLRHISDPPSPFLTLNPLSIFFGFFCFFFPVPVFFLLCVLL